MEKRRACLLARVSTKLESQDSSIDYQLETQIKYLNSRDDLIFDETKDIFSEKISGKKIDRGKKSEFSKFLNLLGVEVKEIYNKDEIEISLKANLKIEPYYKFVSVKSTSRFARSLLTENLLKLLVDIGVEVYFFDLQQSTFDQNLDLLLKFLTYQDQIYSKQVSLNWKKCYWIYKQETKDVKLRCKVFGYDIIKKENSQGKIKRYYVKNEEEYKILRHILKMYLEEERGFHTISKYLLEHYNLKWTKQRVKQTLENKHYCGMEISYNFDDDNNLEEYLKFKVDDKETREFLKTLKKDWYKCEYIEEIFTLEEHNQVISKIKSKKDVYGYGQKNPNLAFSKLLRCAYCNNLYSSRGRHSYYNGERHYQCISITRDKENHRQKSCISNAIFENFLFEFLDNYCKKIQEEKTKIYKSNLNNLLYLRVHLILLLEKNNFDEYVELSEKRDEIKKQISKLFIQKVSYEDSSLEEILNETISELQTEYNSLIEQISFLDDLEKNITQIIQNINSLYNEIQSDYLENMKTKEYKREDLFNELSCILVFPKPRTKGKFIPRNHATLIPILKLEQEIFNLIDNIYNTNIKNVLDENIIFKKEISEFGNKIFKIKKPNDEEVTLASELLDRHNLIEYV